MNAITITDFINTSYKDFAIYTCHHRAIPSLIDGFKPSQRKAFYVVKNKSDFIKVQAVAGQMISDANYHHGDSSASDAISMMGQDFTGSNNIPPFSKKGAFGSKFIKDFSAGRYIYVKPNSKYYSLFKDFEICEANEDSESPEPKFYLPIIPTILINGIGGLAVGFSCKIQSYNIKDIIENVKNVLDSKEQKKMIPFFKGYSGEYQELEDKYVQYGKAEVVNTTTIKITEVPIVYDREKYHAVLNKLIEKKVIVSFEDKSKDEWNIIVKLQRNSKVFDNPIKHLNLTYNLGENINVINQNGCIKNYANVYDLIKDFVEYRLTIYQKRIQYQLDRIKEEAMLTRCKNRFIIDFVNFDMKKVEKKEIEEYFMKIDIFNEDRLKKCFQIQAINMNRDYLLKLKDRMNELKEEFEYYKNTTPKELYIKDLGEIKI